MNFLHRFICVILFLIVHRITFSQTENSYHFSQFNNSISVDVWSIQKDSSGFDWLGTSIGLFKFDGYTFEQYPLSINGEIILDFEVRELMLDSQNSLWIGTQYQGVFKLNLQTGESKNYTKNKIDVNSLSNNNVTDIIEDESGNIWIATTFGLNRIKGDKVDRYLTRIDYFLNSSVLGFLKKRGLPVDLYALLLDFTEKTAISDSTLLALLKINIEENYLSVFDTLTKSSLPTFSVQSSKDEHISSIAQYESQLILGFSNFGICFIDPQTYNRIYFNKQNNRALRSNGVEKVTVYQDKIVVGYMNEGLDLFSFSNGKLILLSSFFTNDKLNDLYLKGDIISVLSDNAIKTIKITGENLVEIQTETFRHINLLDVLSMNIKSDGSIWVGTRDLGLYVFPAKSNFKFYSNKNGLIDQHVSELCVYMENLYVGYYHGQIQVFAPEHTPRSYLLPNIPTGTVFKIFPLGKEKLLLGTYRNGLTEYNPTTKEVRVLSEFNAQFPDIDIREIVQDSERSLWLASHGDGLIKLSPKLELIKHYRADNTFWKNNLVHDWLNTVFVDRNNNIWVGTVEGLSVINQQNSSIVSLRTENSSLSHNNVITIYESKNKEILVGTDKGVNIFNDYDFIQPEYNQYLESKKIKTITEDHNNQLWIGTSNGLSRVSSDGSHITVRNFSKGDGQLLSSVSPNAVAVDNSGIFFIGGKNGITLFNSDTIEDKPEKLKIVLTDLLLFNERVIPGDTIQGKRILHENITYTSEIKLKHNQNSLTFKYTALNQLLKSKVFYKYKLDGFDDKWNEVNEKREAVYTNLTPGSYTFSVNATLVNGLWRNKPCNVVIKISPPLWRTTIAYLIYLIIIVFHTIKIRSVILVRLRLKQKLQLEQVEKEKAQELNLLKLQFFTNISHEIRTPLTLIADPVNILADMESDNKKKFYLNIISKNTSRLLELVNQLLDFRQIEEGSIKPNLWQGDIVIFLKKIVGAYQHEFNRKNIVYLFECDMESYYVWLDFKKMRKIINNIVNNALKYSKKEGGIIRLRLNKTEFDLPLEITISDSGQGIPENELRYIFQPYYRAQVSGTESGSGLGLALVKDLVNILQGEINVNSTVGVGTNFQIKLPAELSSFPVYQFEKEEDNEFEVKVVAESEEEINEFYEESAIDESKTKVLIVEDEADIRKFLKIELQMEYAVIEAKDGREGWELALKELPDVILCDLLMPKMSGNEFCEMVKGNRETSHIPFLFLTAKNTINSKLSSLELGADGYIIKPFRIAEVKAKVRNILKMKEQQKALFLREFNISNDREATNKTEKKFIRQVLEVINNHISDVNFTPDEFARELAISRALLYKKVHAISGLSVSIFVRNIRLKKASKMLRKHDGMVADVAYAVGFSDPAYFSKCFKEYFGSSPKEYKINV